MTKKQGGPLSVADVIETNNEERDMGIHYIEDHGTSAIVHFRSVYYPDISTKEVEEWAQEYVSHGRYVYSLTKDGRLSSQACHGLNPTGPTIMIGDDETVGHAIARACRRDDGHWPKIVTTAE